MIDTLTAPVQTNTTMDHHDHSMHMFDHTGHGGHGGHDMPMHECTMDMLWNTNVIDTCIVFRSWHITSTSYFVLSFFVIVALGVFYEYLRLFSRRFDQTLALSLASSKGKNKIRISSAGTSPERPHEDAGLLTGHRLKAHVSETRIPLVSRLVRAGLYGATVFLSFFLMLVFMTYNAYLILAVVLGAALGHFTFGSTMDTDAILGDSTGGKGMACH